MKKPSSNKSAAGKKRLQFRLDRPTAKKVSVAGDFNNWNVDTHCMLRDNHGVWKKTVMVLPGRYEYRFFADGKWCNDPSSSAKCPNCFGSQNDFIVVSS